MVEQLLARHSISNGPGCAAGVIWKNRVVFEGAAGTSDGRQPLTAATPFYLASVSKQFTAAAVYRLVDSGKLQLEQPIGTIFPKLPPNIGAITVHQLLNHTSGLRDYSALQEIAGHLGPIDNMGVLRLLSSQRALNFEPGTDYEYSNSDYVLLGILVERVSGVAFGEFLKREIFKPLGMKRSWFQPQEPLDVPARGYLLRDGTVRDAPAPPQTTGDGGMYASVADLLLWLQTLDHSSGNAERMMRQLKLRARLKSGEVLPHASGLFWNTYKGRTTISHDGSVAGFQADVVHFPKEHLSVACLCNRGDVDASSLSRQIAGAYLGAGSPVTNEVKSAEMKHALAADLSGKWESRQGFILSTEVEGDHLVASLAGEKHVMSPQPKKNEFIEASDGGSLLLRRPGPDVIQLGWEGDRLNSFTRLRMTPPVSQEVSQYAGRFFNDDLNLEWDLVVTEGSLLITTAAGWRIPLTEAAPDRFEVGPYLLEFEREGGRISGFALHRQRVWRLQFRNAGAERH
jgi:CubicO group peptidase (beta-lactamase class C family)